MKNQFYNFSIHLFSVLLILTAAKFSVAEYNYKGKLNVSSYASFSPYFLTEDGSSLITIDEAIGRKIIQISDTQTMKPHRSRRMIGDRFFGIFENQQGITFLSYDTDLRTLFAYGRTGPIKWSNQIELYTSKGQASVGRFNSSLFYLVTDRKLSVFNQKTGKLIKEVHLPDSRLGWATHLETKSDGSYQLQLISAGSGSFVIRDILGTERIDFLTVPEELTSLNPEIGFSAVTGNSHVLSFSYFDYLQEQWVVETQIYDRKTETLLTRIPEYLNYPDSKVSFPIFKKRLFVAKIDQDSQTLYFDVRSLRTGEVLTSSPLVPIVRPFYLPYGLLMSKDSKVVILFHQLESASGSRQKTQFHIFQK